MLMLGWLGLLYGIFAWLGNPLLFAAWWLFHQKKYKRSAWFSFAAVLAMLEFLLHGKMPSDQGLKVVVSYGAAYWLWLSSSALMVVASVSALKEEEPPTLPAAHLEKRPPPSAILVGTSLVMPILAIFIAKILVATLPRASSGYSAGLSSPLWILGLMTVPSIIGTALSIYLLWKREHWPILLIIGLGVNVSFLLTGFQLAHEFRGY